MRLPYGKKVRPRWWAVVNWMRGYKLNAFQRYRCCDHTTPFHYPSCPMHPASSEVSS